MQSDFLEGLVVFVFRSVIILLMIVQGDEASLPMLPSWPEVPEIILITQATGSE